MPPRLLPPVRVVESQKVPPESLSSSRWPHSLPWMGAVSLHPDRAQSALGAGVGARPAQAGQARQLPAPLPPWPGGCAALRASCTPGNPARQRPSSAGPPLTSPYGPAAKRGGRKARPGPGRSRPQYRDPRPCTARGHPARSRSTPAAAHYAPCAVCAKSTLSTSREQALGISQLQHMAPAVTQSLNHFGWKTPLRPASPICDLSSPCHRPRALNATSSPSLDTSREGDSTTSLAGLPVSDHPFREEIRPNVQSEQLKDNVLSSCC